jgi:hypothetical protein
MAQKRINELTEATTVKSDHYIPVDHGTDGTQKMSMSTLIDSTLAQEGAAADAKATGDAIAEKVDKAEGKGLSTEDYTTEEKQKLTGIEAEATKTIVDSTLTQQGQAADAKATGDQITDLKEDLNDFTNASTEKINDESFWTQGY